MDKTECVNLIMLHLAEIAKIYKGYNPDGDYLSLLVSDNIMMVNNDYWVYPDRDINEQCKAEIYKDHSVFYNICNKAWLNGQRKAFRYLLREFKETHIAFKRIYGSDIIEAKADAFDELQEKLEHIVNDGLWEVGSYE